MPPRTTAIGALAFYVSHANPHDYQPTNITFGIMEPPPGHIRDKQQRKLAISERALADLDALERDAERPRFLRSRAAADRRMKDILKDFLQHLRRRDVSRHTVTAYENDVATFLKHTSQIRQKPVDALGPADVDAFAIRAFLGELHKQRISASSSARKLSAIRTFVKFLRREDLIEDDPVLARGGAEEAPDHSRAPHDRRDEQAARDAGRLESARPPRSRDSRAVLRVGTAA